MNRSKKIKHFRDLEVYSGYIDKETVDTLDNESEQLIAMLNSVEKNATKFCF